MLLNQSQNPRQIASRVDVIRPAFKLVGAQLQAQLENLLARLAFLDAQVGDGQLPQFVKLQRPRPPVPRRSSCPAACAPPAASPPAPSPDPRLPSRRESGRDGPARPSLRGRLCLCPYGFRQASW